MKGRIGYDILDDAGAFDSNATRTVVSEQRQESGYGTPEEFYRQFFELRCSHLFIFQIYYPEGVGCIARTTEALKTIRNLCFGNCSLGVQPVMMLSEVSYQDYNERPFIFPQNEIVAAEENRSKSYYPTVRFKIPVRIDPSDPMITRRTLKFMAAVQSIYETYTNYEIHYETLDWYSVWYYGIDYSELVIKPRQTMCTYVPYTHRFFPRSEYEYNHNPNTCQSGSAQTVTDDIACLLCSENVSFKRVIEEVKKWWKRYTPPPDESVRFTIPDGWFQSDK